MAKTFATATFNDTWAGNVPAELVGFKTKRRGEAVTRYRWTSRVSNTGGFVASGFATIEGAIAAAQRHANFSEVAAA